MLFGAKTRSTVPRNCHASVGDICKAFTDYRDELMWLALLLTGDEQLAETCVVDACTLATTDNEVFQGWLLRWARRATIRSAIEVKRPHIARLAAVYELHPCAHRKHMQLSQETKQLLVAQSDVLLDELDVLCRFALVMRGIENYSDLDSALMLGISTTSLKAAYCAALQHLERLSYELVVRSAETMRTYSSVA